MSQPVFQVIDAKPWHVGQMIRILRKQHQQAMAPLGVNGHRELRTAFDGSYMRRAWLIDGKLTGLGGVVGQTLESVGRVWLALSDEARNYPIEVIKEARRQLAEIMRTKHELATTVLPEDAAAIRLACFLGFHCAQEGRGQVALSKFSRRDLATYVSETPDIRVPLGKSYGMVMAYRGEAI